MHHQHDMAQIQALNELQQHLAVECKLVRALFFVLVALAKADQIGRHHAVAGLGEYGNHVPVQIAPRRVAMQA